MKLIYAGIGSRKTPPNVQEWMKSIGSQLAPNWLLRTGFADGADKAFAYGAEGSNGDMINYLPYAGFNGAPDEKWDARFKVPTLTDEHFHIAANFHPNWKACSQMARLMHGRNVCQVLGENLDEPAHMVVCWTPSGSASGGTGEAIRIARGYNIPVFDLALWEDQINVCEFTWEIEEKYNVRSNH